MILGIGINPISESRSRILGVVVIVSCLFSFEKPLNGLRADGRRIEGSYTAIQGLAIFEPLAQRGLAAGRRFADDLVEPKRFSQ